MGEREEEEDSEGRGYGPVWRRPGGRVPALSWERTTWVQVRHVQGREGLTGSWNHVEVAGAVGPSFGVWGMAASRSPGGTRGLCARQRGLDDRPTGTSLGGNSHAWLRVAVTRGSRKDAVGFQTLRAAWVPPVVPTQLLWQTLKSPELPFNVTERLGISIQFLLGSSETFWSPSV